MDLNRDNMAKPKKAWQEFYDRAISETKSVKGLEKDEDEHSSTLFAIAMLEIYNYFLENDFKHVKNLKEKLAKAEEIIMKNNLQ